MGLQGVTTPISKPTAWVSSLTYPCKPGGSLCICLDPKDLDKAIAWDHYKAPTLDEISHQLSGATCFSKIDAKDGFRSIHLDEDTSYLTTFNTQHGRYRFLLMPFGLKMSQDVFQMQIDQAADHLPGIIAIHDDKCIFCHTPEEHDEHLLCLMQSAKTHGIVFNSTKCHIRHPQIAFYGAVFTGQGMQMDPAKIKALQDLPAQDLQTKLQSFWGLINYLQPFIPGRSNKTMFLQEQISQCDWNPLTDAGFHHLKAWICQTLVKVTLAYYDRSKPVVVQTDASEYRLGAALLQGCQPIAFTSKTLTDIEICYANIERVSFSLLWSGEIPHLYTWEACNHREWP